jgi:hypothetical protein
MKKIIDEFNDKFLRVKGLGYIPLLNGFGDGDIGRLFEDKFGVIENNSPLADWNGIEIKTKKEQSDSKVTLFSKAPIWKYNISNNDRVYNYGYESDGTYKLNIAISYKTNNLGWKSNVNYNNKVVELLLDGVVEATYPFETIQSALESKLNTLAIINTVIINNSVLFDSYNILNGINMKQFLSYIETGKIVIEFRMRIGKDRGTAFRIPKKYMYNLYNSISLDGHLVKKSEKK